jgi:hypothetical protein
VIVGVALTKCTVFGLSVLPYSNQQLNEHAEHIVTAEVLASEGVRLGALSKIETTYQVIASHKGTLQTGEEFSALVLSQAMDFRQGPDQPLDVPQMGEIFYLYLKGKNQLGKHALVANGQGSLKLFDASIETPAKKQAKPFTLITTSCLDDFGVAYWSYASMPIPLTIDRSSLDYDPAILDSIQAMVNEWQGVTTSYLAFTLAELSDENIGYDSITNTGSVDYLSIYEPYIQEETEVVRRHEIIFDEDGEIIFNLFGGDPDSVLGVGYPIIDEETCEIVDAFLILNLNIDFELGILEAALAHELGHFVGIGHSSVTDPLMEDEILPTLFYSIFPRDDSQGRTIEVDDRAALSTLYPANSFSETFGAINGQVVDTDLSGMFGVSVVAINRESKEAIGILSGHNEGDSGDGHFVMTGVPAGTYAILVQSVDGSEEVSELSPANIGGIFTGADRTFTTEFLNDIDVNFVSGEKISIPDEAISITVEAGKTTQGLVIVNEGANDLSAMEMVDGSFPQLVGSEGFTAETAPAASSEGSLTIEVADGCGLF